MQLGYWNTQHDGNWTAYTMSCSYGNEDSPLNLLGKA